jgi:hypothetical protein
LFRFPFSTRTSLSDTIELVSPTRLSQPLLGILRRRWLHLTDISFPRQAALFFERKILELISEIVTERVIVDIDDALVVSAPQGNRLRRFRTLRSVIEGELAWISSEQVSPFSGSNCSAIEDDVLFESC